MIMKNALIELYKIMFVFIPIPLFFDFGSMQLVINNVDEYNFIIKPSVPMPIGGIALFLAVLIGYLCSMLYKDYFRSVFTPVKLLLFYSFAVIPIFFYVFFVVGLSLSRVIQLLLPIFFISFLSFPVLLKDRLDMLKYTYISAFLFFSLHFFSVVKTSNDLLNINDWTEFSGVFGVRIYQSLVSYPAVLFLYLFLTLALIYVSRKDILPRLKRYSFFAYFFIFVLLYLLAASGRRAFLVEYIAAMAIVLIFTLISMLTSRVVKKRTVWYLSLFTMLFISFFVFFMSTPLSYRVLNSIEANTFDSGRVNILANAFDYFTNNLSVLLFGGGPRDVPGFHNFILDQIYRIGLFGMFAVYITMFLLIRKFVKINDLGTSYIYHRRMFTFVLLGSLFLQSMINASVSQPYYFINFLMVAVFIYFALFTEQNSAHNINLKRMTP